MDDLTKEEFVVLKVKNENYDIDYIFENLANYVNDAIGFRLKPEVTLKYSQVCFGTADAIDYKERDKFLRIHDYKSGTTPASMDQLLIYDAYYARLSCNLYFVRSHCKSGAAYTGCKM